MSSMTIKVHESISIDKHPDAELDYKIDWTAWLEGDTITNSIWDVPTPLVAENSISDSTSATIWLSGGVEKSTVVVKNSIVTALGREESKSIKFYITSKG